ncbi:hypothetical protein [Solibacillus cecembensis]|uniref:hypothetical protein n=1 Tax=Solibacillus cecembensis TaxID=459347 RepID=UPI003CFFB93F
MKKLKVLTMTAALSITGLGLFPIEKADASELIKSEAILDASALDFDTSVLDSQVLNELDDSISTRSISGSGWQTKGGIKAKVSTDKDQYGLGESVKVKAERSGSSPTVYYRVDIYKQEGSMWNKTPDSGKKGTFSSGAHSVTLKTYGPGMYKVYFKVWADSSEEYWIGDWETSFSSH